MCGLLVLLTAVFMPKPVLARRSALQLRLPLALYDIREVGRVEPDLFDPAAFDMILTYRSFILN